MGEVRKRRIPFVEVENEDKDEDHEIDNHKDDKNHSDNNSDYTITSVRVLNK